MDKFILNDFNKPLHAEICQLFVNGHLLKHLLVSWLAYYLNFDLYLLLVTIFKIFTYYFLLLLINDKIRNIS